MNNFITQYKQYFAYLDGSLIDSNGFKTTYGITADTKREANRLLAKAKRHYLGTYKVDASRFRVVLR